MVETIRPGSSKAQLVLPDGRRVDLEVDRGCQQLKGENFVNDGKQLVYHEQENGKRIQWHTLSVPRGGEYKLVLADGTRVWLNSQTRLVYPTCFVGSERVIELDAESGVKGGSLLRSDERCEATFFSRFGGYGSKGAGYFV